MSGNRAPEAGEMDQRVSVLVLTTIDDHSWLWTAVRSPWAAVRLLDNKVVFAEYGMKADGAEFILRRQALNLDNAIQWRGEHYHITAIAPCGPAHIRVTAARVSLCQCADRYPEVPVTFPGVLVERYSKVYEHGWEQLEPQVGLGIHRVLVTPRSFSFRPGRLVEIDGGKWPVRVAHEGLPGHNEFELCREVDL